MKSEFLHEDFSRWHPYLPFWLHVLPRPTLWWWCCLVPKLYLTLLWPHGLQSARLICPWDFPGMNTGMGSHLLLQGIFDQMNLCFLCWQGDSLPLSYLGSPAPKHTLPLSIPMLLNYFGVLNTAEAPSHSAFVHAKLEIKQKVSECIPKSTVVFVQLSSIVCVCVYTHVRACWITAHFLLCIRSKTLQSCCYKVFARHVVKHWFIIKYLLNEGRKMARPFWFTWTNKSNFFFLHKTQAAPTKILRQRSQNGKDHKLWGPQTCHR